ncbi:hypothetical protein RAC69_05550 [Microbacterium sp. LS_15]|uniref:hypothetical protein n=1 Tax=Microbacterium sp. LS_15 TaxID=3055790 RepID=UPI0035C21880
MMTLVPFLRDHPIAAVIVLCEIGLWVLLGAGLLLRYPAGRKRLGGFVLLLIPLLDVVLVVATAIDLWNGSPFDLTHGLAGIYLGFSVAFGPAIVRWADVRFAHRFAGGPAPVAPAGRAARQAALWKEWRRVVVAAAIASGAYLVLMVVATDADAAESLWWWIGRAWVVVGLWLLFGPVWGVGGGSTGEAQAPAPVAERPAADDR